MASINGVTIKSLNKFVGSEGEAFQGNVYYNGRKLGFWSQDGNGGSDHFSFSIELLKKPLEQYKNYLNKTGLVKNGPVGSEQLLDSDDLLLEIFMSEVLNIVNIEKQFKINKRNGFPYTLMVYPINDFMFITLKLKNGIINKLDLQMIEDKVRRQVLNLNPSHKVFKLVSKVIKDVTDLELVWGEISVDSSNVKEKSVNSLNKKQSEYIPNDSLKSDLRKEKNSDLKALNSRFECINQGSSALITDKITGRSCEVPLYSLSEVMRALKEFIV